MKYKTITFEEKDGIATITLSRPDVLNALNKEMLSEIHAALEESQKKGSIRVVVITGKGRAFSAGADVKNVYKASMSEVREIASLTQRLTRDIRDLGKPVITKVNGLAMGAGCELCVVSDICIASEKAKFGLPDISVVLPLTSGTSKLLAELIGDHKAKELVLTGEPIDAMEAMKIGLVNAVVPAEKLDEETKEVANKIIRHSPLAVKLFKSAMDTSKELSLNSALKYEIDALSVGFATEDSKEGILAFIEKRKPRYKGK